MLIIKRYYFSLIFIGLLGFTSCKEKPKKEIEKKVPLTIVKPEKPFVFGVDISHFNNNEIDLLIKRKDSLQFVICKATEGVTYIDPKFKMNWNDIKEKGFIRGAYHFYRTQDDPITQANFYLNTVNSFETNDIPPIIDFEEAGIDKTQSIETIQTNLLSFIKEVEKKGNVIPIIYTDINCGNTYLNNSVFSKYPLWIADYNGKKQPDLPNTWKTKGYLIWQKTDNYKIVNATDDADIFNGNLTKFKAFIKNSYY
ncbi:GH25 family lysozyme [Polaribacter sp. Hel1_85]|uniref:GH25 family lysozyme n=1 Tax=Polaribacter sp. Hel1_85 TaxID=1250005 RepID=UPI00052BC38B|nr:GH25 family lysozyme [Polaribacter sp. Hel1_85]KGL63293.1 glycoside hydrolase, GH25 family [Polaribacter sp. Hel1_85]